MQTIDGKELVDGLMAKARREGRDLWDVMESDGFMLTKTRSRQIKSQALDAMLYVLEAETAERVLQRYLGGRPGTPQDMFNAMLLWIKDYQVAMDEGHV
jgi:hypothetical protein